MRLISSTILAVIMAIPCVAQPLAVEQSLAPTARPDLPVVQASSPLPNRAEAGFPDWVKSFRKRALALGIRGDIYDLAFQGIHYNEGIVEKDRNQSEFTKQIWTYLATAVSDARVKNGRAALKRQNAVLGRIEARYGVEKEVLTAIWGLESAYGTFRGKTPTIEALATLAYDGRRAEFFETQLIAALRILQAGDVTPQAMRGSWAGAMGHTQFMPLSYQDHAQDFDRNGKRDIWGDDPVDALASAAAYLQANGWTRGQPWGIEVNLPKGFDYALTTERVKRPTQFWLERGVVGAHGKTLPKYPQSSILLPAGHTGPAFIIYPNFQVLETYNTADAYVIGVGHLADRIAGGKPISAGWPFEDRALSFTEKQEMQRHLLAKGFDPQGVDGIIGPRTIAAVQEFQKSIGWVPDGYVSAKVLDRLRQ